MVEIDWKTESGLVVQHAHIDGCRSTHIIQSKAQPKRNGQVQCEGCDAALGYLGSSLSAICEAVASVVVPLAKGAPLPARHASRSTASQAAVRFNMNGLDH